MKNWLSDNLPFIVFVAILCMAISVLVALAVKDGQADKLCQSAGYIKRLHVDGQLVCIGYVEGNQMIVVDFESVKAGAE